MKFRGTLFIKAFAAIVMFCVLCLANASAQTQKVTVRLANAQLKEVFKAIEKQTSYRFSYRNSFIDHRKDITITQSNVDVTVVLDEALKNRELEYQIVSPKMIAIYQKRPAASPNEEQVKISGTIIDENGEPIIGANLAVPGTLIGDMTDENGCFSLEVPSYCNLVVSYIGYHTQVIPTKGKSRLSIVMREDTKRLDEFVKVGYGKQRKGNLTGSVVEVKSEKLTIAPLTNVTNTLGGQLPGLVTKQQTGLPGSDGATLSIRGFDAPLVIVDGTESSLDNLDQSQIETITILKDGSASIYGARAGNGVVLVTTKRGMIQKPTITVNTSLSVQGVTNMLKPASSGERAQMEREIHLNSGLPEETAPWTAQDVQKFFQGDDPSYVNADWYGYVCRGWAPQHNQNISIRGGSEKIRYYGLFAYSDQQTIIRNNGGGYSRYNIQTNMDAHVTDHLTLTIDLAVVNENRAFATRNLGTDGYWWQDYFTTKPWFPTQLPDASKNAYGGIDTGSMYVSSNMDISGYKKSQKKETSTSASLSYSVPKVNGLELKAFVNYKDYSTYGKNFYQPVTCYTYNSGLDQYTEIPTSSNEVSLTESLYRGSVVTRQYSVSYNNRFSDHRLDGILLYESIDYKDNNFGAGRSGFLTDEIDQMYAGGLDSQTTSGSASVMGRVSWVSRLNYSYREKYLVEAIFRADASAKFAPDKRWGFFPSVSLGWNMHHEPFLRKFDALDQLKLRTSYGRSGNDNVGSFQYLTGYSIAGNYLSNGNTSSLIHTTGLANPDLTWEQMGIFNAGIDYSWFNHALFGTVEYFNRKRTGIPGYRTSSLPFTFGAEMPQENLNAISTVGFECSVGSSGHIADLTYQVEGNISWSRSKWLIYDETKYLDRDQVRVYQRTGTWTDRQIGYRSAGLFTSQEEIDKLTFVYQDLGGNSTLRPGDVRYVDVNHDGLLNWRDKVDLGPGSMPHWIYGLVSSFSYKNFDMQLFFQGAFRYTVNADIYSNKIALSSKLYQLRWTPENNDPHALAPRLGGSSSNSWLSDYTLREASYVRLKNFALGYQLPRTMLDRLKLQTLRIYLAATNLFTLSNLNAYGLDPEFPMMYYYPQQRTLSVGMNISL